MKRKALVCFQHFDRHDKLLRESSDWRTVYSLQNGKHYINYLGGRRYVKVRDDHFVAFGSKQMPACGMIRGSQFVEMVKRGLTNVRDLPDELLNEAQRREIAEDKNV